MGRRLGELHGKSKEASSVSVVGAVDDPEMVVAEVHRFSLFLNLLLEFSRPGFTETELKKLEKAE